MPTHVLIVEDEDAVRELLSEYLRGRGLTVVERRSAAEGARALSDQPIDLLITDLKLPDGDGLELVRLAATRPVPPACVVMSGYATVDDAIAALTLGAVDLILKPFRLRDAHAALQRALARGAEERSRRLAHLAARWLESSILAQTPNDARLLVPALKALLAAWEPDVRLEVRDGLPEDGWSPLGAHDTARIVGGDDRCQTWLRALSLAFDRAAV